MSDWKDVFKEAVAAGTGKLDSRGKGAAGYMKEIAAAHRKSLESLLAAFVDGQIDRETFDAELADERRIVKAELVAVQGIGKKGAHDAAHAFFGVIQDALAAGIGGLL